MHSDGKGSLKEFKHQLMTEINALSQAFEKSYFELQRLEKLENVTVDIDPRIELPAHMTSVSAKNTNLKKRLDLTSKVNGIVFQKVENVTMEDNKIQILAEGRAGPVILHIMLEMKENGDEYEIQELKANLQDSFQMNELRSWINSCLRKNNLQFLLRGVAEYSDLFQTRDSLLEWLYTDFTEFFSIHEMVDDVGYMIDATHKSSGVIFLKAQWKLKWNKHKCVMENHFTFAISVGDLQKELTDICQRISDGNNTSHLKELWKELGNRILTETLRRMEDSSSGSTEESGRLSL